MNSADKTAGWDNGQAMVNGVIRTSQGLDLTTGAGRLDVAAAANNFLNGSFDPMVVGSAYVGKSGWDLSTVTANAPNIYDLGILNSGSTLSATVDWFAQTSYNADTFDPSLNAFTNLDLEVLQVLSPGNTQLIAVSDSMQNNVQQLYFNIQTGGEYELEVLFDGVQYAPAGSTITSDQYALAWSSNSVPEPAAMGVIAPVAVCLLRRRRREALT